MACMHAADMTPNCGGVRCVVGAIVYTSRCRGSRCSTRCAKICTAISTTMSLMLMRLARARTHVWTHGHTDFEVWFRFATDLPESVDRSRCCETSSLSRTNASYAISTECLTSCKPLFWMLIRQQTSWLVFT